MGLIYSPIASVDGIPGATGASAYDVAVANGFVGTEVEWLVSLKANESENITFEPVEGNAFIDTKICYHPMGYDFLVQELIVYVDEPPTGSALVVDINIGGVSVLSTKLTVDADEVDSTTAAIPYVLDTPLWTKGSRVSVDIDQVGATTPGTYVRVVANGVRV